MSRFLLVGVLAGLVACLTGSALLAQQEESWPQWRGPDRTDIGSAENTLQEWPSGGPEQLWISRKGGLGYSGFAVVQDFLVTMGEEDGQQFVTALDPNTGSTIWTTPTGRGYENRWGGGPRGTPTIDADRVYALDARGKLVCLNLKDGAKIWSQDLTELGGKIPQWGYSESVFVDSDQVVCTPGGSQGAVAAFNKESGELKWQLSGNTEVAHYSSIMKAEINGQLQYVQLMAKKLLGISMNGDLLWQSDWPGRTAVIPTPIIEGNEVYISSGYGVGSKKVKVGSGNEVSDVWKNTTMKNHHGGVIKVDNHLYGYSDRVGWVCQDWTTGEMVWNFKKMDNQEGGLGKGAIGYANGQFICVSESTGTVVLIDAVSSGWSEKGRFTLEPQTDRRKPQGRIWVHPVVVDGKLYLRDQEIVYCYDVSDK